MSNILYYRALQLCADRYFHMAQDVNLRLFIIEFSEGILTKMPLMKLNRWLGYIQGVLITQGITTVQAERDWTRPLFRPLDYKEN